MPGAEMRAARCGGHPHRAGPVRVSSDVAGCMPHEPNAARHGSGDLAVAAARHQDPWSPFVLVGVTGFEPVASAV